MIIKEKRRNCFVYYSDDKNTKLVRKHDNRLYSEIVSKKDIEKELTEYGK